MKTGQLICLIIILIFIGCSPASKTGLVNNNDKQDTNITGWISLFDGKSLKGWKAGDNAGTFSVENGMIVAHGDVAHLFYIGEVGMHNFKNFEFKADVMTTLGSNSGIYFHTTYQDKSWPQKGYEVQVNNSHTDWRRTGGLYGIQDVKDLNARDNVWYTQHIVVRDNHVITMVNDRIVVDYAEPDNVKRPKAFAGRLISSGTFALQGHDPGSKVFFKGLKVRLLPD